MDKKIKQKLNYKYENVESMEINYEYICRTK